MKNTMNPSRELYNILLSIYGEKCWMIAVHSTINEINYDRWGTKADITLLDGTHVVGRLSRNHKFNGTVGNDVYRSYRA